MKRVLLGSLVGLAGLVVAPAIASASPTSGTEHFQLTAVNDQPGAIVARGVFTASGIDYPKSNRDLAVFSDGAFTIHHPGGTNNFSVNQRTCLVTFTFTGSYTINNGYGRFQGITGSGTYSGRETGVLPRNANGTCDLKSQPFSTVQRIDAHGPVSFS
jgi:hypothetical protein